MPKSILNKFSLFALACSLALSAAVASDAPKRIDVPAGDLIAALQSLEKQSDAEFVYHAAQLKGVHTRGLSGTFTVQEAVQELIKGTELKMKIDLATGAMLISKVAAVPTEVTGASTQGVSETNLKLVKKNPAEARVESEASALLPEGERQNSRSDEVVVTGSRLKRSGVDDSAAPIVVFDRKRMDELGATTVADVLKYSTQQSFMSSENDVATGARTVQLRGLGPATTLVLIDGRRSGASGLRAMSNEFDINSIPLAIVERIEVLPGASSAVYGADAVGGVINIITKRETKPSMEAYLGSAKGGDRERRITGSAGHRTERWRISTLVNATDRSRLIGSERDLRANQDFRRFGGSDLRTLTTNPPNVSRTGGNLPGLNTPYATLPLNSPGTGLTAASFIPIANAADRRMETLTRYRDVIPEMETFNFTTRMGYALRSHLELFADASYNRSQMTNVTDLTGRTVTVPVSNPFNPFGVPVSVAFFLPGLETEATTNTYRSALGAAGSFASWDWELSIAGTRDNAHTDQMNVTVTTPFTDALANSNPALSLNVFRSDGGPIGTPEVLAIALPSSRTFGVTTQLQGGGFIRGPVFSLPAGSVQLVAGAEQRREKIDSFNTILRTVAHRDVSAAYTEIAVPLIDTSMAVPLVQRLAATVGLRYDDYSDFGDSVNEQYGVQWQLLKSITVRGTYGTSFRAPTLYNLYQPLTVVDSLTTDPRRGPGLVPVIFHQRGNPNLAAEQSESWSTGLLFAPSGPSDFRISVDYWNIDQSATIRSISPTVMLANEGLFANQIHRGPVGSDGFPVGPLVTIDLVPVNFGTIATRGIDFQTSGRIDTTLGTWTPSFSATWTRSYLTAIVPNTPLQENVGNAYNPASGSVPKWKTAATLAWDHAGLGLAVSGRRVSKFTDATTLGVPLARTLPAQTLIDLSASVDLERMAGHYGAWTSGLMLRAGASNLFDKAPPFSVFSGPNGTLGDQYSLIQRFLYVTLSKQF